MARSPQQIGTVVRTEIEVFTSQNVPVLGLVTADFDILLSANGIDVSVPGTIPVTVTEVGDGRYSITFTPNASTYWNLVIRNDTYNERGWSEGFDVTADGFFTINDIFTKDDMIETGWDLRNALRVMAAVLCGRVTGGPGSAVFTNLQQTAPRVTTVADTSGNRSIVTLSP